MAKKEITTQDFDDDTLRLVYKYAQGLSARQVAEKTGLTPIQALAARKQVLDTVDPLTINEWRTKILLDLQKLSDDAIAAFDHVEDKAKAPMFVAATGALKTVLNEMRNMEKADTKEVDALNARRVRELLRLVENVVMRLIGYVDENSELDREDLTDMMFGWLSAAAEELDGDNG
jgi:hypothetical protein